MKSPFRIHMNEKGLSILEIVASIFILSLILLSVMSLFSTSAKVVSKSAEVLDATYYAQKNMEEVLQLSKMTENSERSVSLEGKGWTKTPTSPAGSEEYTKEAALFLVKLLLAEEGEVMKIELTVHDKTSPHLTEARMESYAKWKK